LQGQGGVVVAERRGDTQTLESGCDIEADALVVGTDFLPGRGSSAGGGYSTAHDLLRLLNALRAHKIDQAPEAGMVGIAGGAPGLNAAMEGGLEGGYDVIVLANLDPPAAGAVSRLIRQSLGLAPPPGPGRRRG